MRVRRLSQKEEDFFFLFLSQKVTTSSARIMRDFVTKIRGMKNMIGSVSVGNDDSRDLGECSSVTGSKDRFYVYQKYERNVIEVDWN